MQNCVSGEPHIVLSYTTGNTRIRVCDDYCREKTPEEVQDILTRIGERAFDALSRVHEGKTA